MNKLSLVYRVGFFLLVAALLLFSFADEITDLFAAEEAGGGFGDRGRESESLNWSTIAMYFTGGSGMLLLVIAGIVDACLNKPKPVPTRR